MFPAWTAISKVKEVLTKLVAQVHPHHAIVNGFLHAEEVVVSPDTIHYKPRPKASWRSGYAEDCKSLHPGSIPGEASNPTKSYGRLNMSGSASLRTGHLGQLSIRCYSP